MALDYFVQHILPISILVVGSVGNLTGLSLFLFGKKLNKLSIRNMYIYLFSVDTIFLVSILVDYFEMGYSYEMSAYSEYTCKLNTFFRYSFANISPMILVYISIERYIAIKYPAKRFKLKKNHTQLLYLMLVFGINLIFYTPFSLLIHQIEGVDHSSGMQRKICSFGDESDLDSTLAYLDLINRVVIPFCLMLISSILLIVCIFKSRQRVYTNYTNIENKIFKRDVRLSLTSLILNFFYVAFNLPLSFNELFEMHDLSYAFAVYMFYASYGINFYLVLFSNFIFRKEFLYCIKRKAHKNKPTQFTYEMRYYNSTPKSSKNSREQAVKITAFKCRAASSYF